MMRIILLSVVTSSLFVACVSHGPYEPATKPEKREYSVDRPDVFPDQVRQNLDRYTNTPVIWVGVIQSTDAREEDNGGKIRADTVLEQHYFNWEQTKHCHSVMLNVSPRGEGRFRIMWRLRKLDPDASAATAEKYAKKGRLAIVYGVPENVEADGTVDLGYRYLRVLDFDEFSTNSIDYGRFGQYVPTGKGSSH